MEFGREFHALSLKNNSKKIPITGRLIMLSKRLTLGIYLFLLLTAGCDIFEPESSSGTLNIIMKKPQTTGRLNKKLGKQLSDAHCIINKYNAVEYATPLLKRVNCFQTRITHLKSGGNYSIFLYGKNSPSLYIAVSAQQSRIEIKEGKETTIELSWSPFITTLNTPKSGDTVSVNCINLEWDPVVGAKVYRLIVDDDIDFIRPIIARRLGRNYSSIRFGSFQEGTYYWKVQCIGSWIPKNPTSSTHIKDREGPWSEVSSFVYKK
jgi:hypothetical protein